MSLAAMVAPHLPFLRRYARAITGSQKDGDAYVRATLEAILADKAALEGAADPRVGLYRLFHVIWSGSAALSEVGEQTGTPRTPDERLQALHPANREALLLSAVEGFSQAEVAIILAKSAAEVEEAIASAQIAIEEELATRVLIIEDEPLIALDLQELMTELGHEVVGIAATRDDAVRLAKSRQPGLVLADVRLADGSSGIDAVTEILRTFEVPVIFITAYPERLLTGERPEPTYLITKPFLPETVKAAVGQALFFRHPGRQAA